ncbi:hypothetical protein HZC09_01100 [Candidatus Micrarchaeota archaeon]|nr:hypothetical protein [Candidatus Micrarchaeota archaeon]
MKKEFRFWFRAAVFALLLVLLYSHGAPLPLLAFLAVFLGALLLARERLWRKINKKIGEVNFMKDRPEWQRWLLVMALFVFAYLVLRYALFFVLKLFGFDFQAEIAKALGQLG